MDLSNIRRSKDGFKDGFSLGRVLINPCCKRSSLNVRFAPKATELLRRREMTQRANRVILQCRKIASLFASAHHEGRHRLAD